MTDAGAKPGDGKCLLADRSMVGLLTGDRMSELKGLRALVQQYGVIAYEAAGASELERRIQDNNSIQGRTLSVSSSQLPKLAEADTVALRHELDALVANPSVQVAVQNYIVDIGGVKREDKELIGYWFRLLMMARTLSADILCSFPRYKLVRQILKETGLSPTEKRGSADLYTLEVESSFPLPPTSVGAQRIKILSFDDLAAKSVFRPEDLFDPKTFVRRTEARWGRTAAFVVSFIIIVGMTVVFFIENGDTIQKYLASIF